MYTLDIGSQHGVAFTQNQRGELRTLEVAGALSATGGMTQQTYLATDFILRKLMPIECERLQGFPDDFTKIQVRGKPAADGPRYHSIGNSMPVNVMRWIGMRIDLVNDIFDQQEIS